MAFESEVIEIGGKTYTVISEVDAALINAILKLAHEVRRLAEK